MTLPFFKIGNEVMDVLQPIMGPQCFTVYCHLKRCQFRNPDLKHTIRDVASATSLSRTTISRSIEILVHLGLVEVHRVGGSQESEAKLLDAAEAAASLGARYDRRTLSWVIPPERLETLQAELKSIRLRQQAKTITGIGTPCGKTNSRVSQRNAGDSPEQRQRATRETPAGAHQLFEEVRTGISLSPTPFQNNELCKSKNHANEDGTPQDLLTCARMQFTGVINDMKDHLFQPRPALPQLKAGFSEWQNYGLGKWAVEEAARDGETLVLVLSVPNTASAADCVDKYRRKWNEMLAKWFGCGIRIKFVRPEDER